MPQKSTKSTNVTVLKIAESWHYARTMNLLSSIPRMLFLIVVIGLVVAPTGTNWSSVRAGGEEWRPVDAADLALKAAVVEPNADAEAIFWDIRIDDGGYNDLVLSHYVRIKIFTERGRDKHSKVEIPYIVGALDNADRPSPIAAGTISKYEVKMGITKDQSTLTYNRTFFFGGEDAILFAVEHYATIKRLFDEVNRGDNHMITLKQIASEIDATKTTKL